jgi:hypothetical protein
MAFYVMPARHCGTGYWNPTAWMPAIIAKITKPVLEDFL